MVIAVDSHKLAYMALPKAACTSVKRMLAAVDETVDTASEKDIKAWHAAYPTRRFRPHRWKAYANHFRFCVVRDPARRLMSCYTDLVLNRNELTHSPRLRRSKDLPTDPDPDHFFTNLEAYQRRSSLVKHHAMGAHLFLGPRFRAHYDRIYRTSELPDLARDLSDRTCKRLTAAHANATPARLTLDDLKSTTIDAIRDFLNQEYAYFDGFFDNPLH